MPVEMTDSELASNPCPAVVDGQAQTMCVGQDTQKCLRSSLLLGLFQG